MLFLDEPSIGLDPVGARELRTTVKALVERGTTVLLTTHYMFEADEFCDRTAVITRLANPATELPGWVRPISWALAPTWGMSAIRAGTEGGNPWPNVGACVGLAAVCGIAGALVSRRLLDSARIHATLALT